MEETDGRRARTEKSRDAVINATIDLIQEGRHPLTAEDIAQRANVSMSSLFRYFDGLQELQLATINRYLERYATAFEITDYCRGDLPTRINNLVNSRLALHETTEYMARFVRARSYDHETLRNGLHQRRIDLTHQVASHLELGPELAQLVAVLTSFETWDQMAKDYLRTTPQISVIWVRTIHNLLGHHELSPELAAQASGSQ
jgi:TetR/AcrR family transcriptional regulator of autoinduction and epiphytic fitness